MSYVPTIGLEVHAQLNTNTKMFCPCRANYGEEPNTLVCPVCLGLPGAMPVLNGGAIEQTILTGLMLGCEINPVSTWDRKNYFYPDMPKNFQLTQMDLPLCLGGGVPLYELAYPKDAQKTILNPGKVVRLNRIHLEEDVGKSTHHASYTSVDFNRAGTPLMEIVTEPDLDTAEEVVAYLGSLRQILVYGGVSDADMEKGQMRCDVNISVRPEGTTELGEKIELKNLNSPSAIRRAIHYEVERQIGVLEDGGTLKQSTWRWDDDRGETLEMRSKENSDDYRYFPEPDLLPVHTATLKAKAEARLPELPHQKEVRFVEAYGLTPYDASVLASEGALADWYEQSAKGHPAPKKVANWVTNNLLGQLNETSLEITDCPISPQALGALVTLVEDAAVNGNQAKEVFHSLWETPREDVAALAIEMGFEPADDSEVEAIIDEVLAANAEVVAEIQSGNPKAAGRLVGLVMKQSGGKANPRMVSESIAAKLA